MHLALSYASSDHLGGQIRHDASIHGTFLLCVGLPKHLRDHCNGIKHPLIYVTALSKITESFVSLTVILGLGENCSAVHGRPMTQIQSRARRRSRSRLEAQGFFKCSNRVGTDRMYVNYSNYTQTSTKLLAILIDVPHH